MWLILNTIIDRLRENTKHSDKMWIVFVKGHMRKVCKTYKYITQTYLKFYICLNLMLLVLIKLVV